MFDRTYGLVSSEERNPAAQHCGGGFTGGPLPRQGVCDGGPRRLPPFTPSGCRPTPPAAGGELSWPDPGGGGTGRRRLPAAGRTPCPPTRTSISTTAPTTTGPPRGPITPTASCAGALGLEPFDRAAHTAVDVPDFYGTFYSRARTWNAQPDTLTYYDLDNPLTIYTVTGPGMPTEGQTTGLYDLDKLDVYDKYAAFLHGNNGLSRVEGDGEGRILVIKDSYANSFVPFLTAITPRSTWWTCATTTTAWTADRRKRLRPDPGALQLRQLQERPLPLPGRDRGMKGGGSILFSQSCTIVLIENAQISRFSRGNP